MKQTIHGDTSRNALSSVDDLYVAVFDAVNDGIFVVDPVTAGFIDVNQPGCRMFGYTKAEITCHGVGMLSSGVPPYTQDHALEIFEKAASGKSQIVEWQCKKKSGDFFWTEISLCQTKLGHTPAIISIVRDITERKEQQERFRQIAESISEVFWMSNPEKTTILYVSPGYEAVWGRSCQSLYENAAQWLDAIHEDDRARIIEKANCQAHGNYREEYRIIRPDGEVRWISDRAFPVCDENGKVYRIVGVASDITERKRLDAEIEKMAHNDALTKLPNRFAFTKTLDRAFARSRRTGKKFAILSLDLDNFKDVNDTRGHAIGDQLLQLVAERLQASVRLNENVARFGGDEFAILLQDPIDPEEIAVLANRLIASVSEPYLMDGIESHVSASIGVAISGKDGRNAETLMTNADIALYRAKAEGREAYRFFSNTMQEEVLARVRLTNELRFAIPNGQLFLVYQPQVRATDGRIVGVEALVRWRHPRRGTLIPAQFLPVAEATGLIAPLGEWVLREACRQGREWIDAGISPGTMCVNISSVQHKRPFELEKMVTAVLTETGLPSHLLELEITESALINISPQYEKVIHRLRGGGVRFALDDFGTGNSSLNHMRRIPIDRIKIAREFIAELATSTKAAAIVKLILGLAHELGSDVVAEGVEASNQLSLLQDWADLDVQGFYFATPMSAKAIAPLLRAGTIDPVMIGASSSAA